MTHSQPVETSIAVSRPLGLNDLRWSAKLHHTVLPDSFFARLGVPFLRAYHRSFVESPHALAVVIEVEGEAAGIALGTVNGAAHYRRVLRSNGRSLGLAATGGLITQPILLGFFLRTRAKRYVRAAMRMLRRSSRPVAQGASTGHDDAELVHIAIDPKLQGRGVGSKLLTDFEALLRSRGIRSVRTETNTATDFYVGRGWKEVSRNVADLDGRPFVLLTHDLTDETG